MNTPRQYTGLTAQEVADNRRKYGANVLTPPVRQSLWRLFFMKFTDPLILILLIAGLLSVGISCYSYYCLDDDWTVFFEPAGIFVAVLLATGLSFFFEQRAEKAFTLLNTVSDDQPVTVIREGNAVRIPRKDVVPGDIAVIADGDEIPADGDLLEAVSLHVDESSLTGEPVCMKTTDERHFDPQATYPSDRVMRGTKVMEGHGVFRVTAIGDATENGKVFTEVHLKNTVKTPLDEQLDRLSKWITLASYFFAALIIIGRTAHYLIFEPYTGIAPMLAHLLNTVMIAVTVIVVAVPEGLPMAVTLSLAYSMRNMLKTNNLVRSMHACETMGAATVICTDKTGTLTENRMRVAFSTFDRLTPALAEGIAVNTTAALNFSTSEPSVVGNPTEGALLLWLFDHGYDYRILKNQAERVREVPFSTERKYMRTTVISAVTGKETTYTKGAPEIVYSLCRNHATDEGQLRDLLTGCQEKGYRTLALAEDDTFLGVVAISDPVRSDVPAAAKECLDAGISVKIVTGDAPLTAREIAREIGLWHDDDTDDNMMTGQEMAALSDEELQRRASTLKIISRARPLDKKRLVEALQREGQVVAVTGDGTNDAPALKAAHVGLSMGDGSAVAKEASDITIIDDSFSSIGRAVMWGRSLYKNIQRFLLFQLTVNVSACLIVIAGAFLGTESPLTVTQMLWVNLIMDTFGAMALASLPPSHSVMRQQPRRRGEFILTPPLLRNIFGVGLAFFLMLLVLLYVFRHADITAMRDLLTCRLGAPDRVTPYEQTLLFSIFVWAHFWYMFCARAFYTGKSIFALPYSKGFVTICAVIAIGQFIIVEVLGHFFNVVPLRGEDWLVIIAVTSVVVWIREIRHAFN